MDSETGRIPRPEDFTNKRLVGIFRIDKRFFDGEDGCRLPLLIEPWARMNVNYTYRRPGFLVEFTRPEGFSGDYKSNRSTTLICSKICLDVGQPRSYHQH